MALPASLLRAVETHVCFSGCYSASSDVFTCTDANLSPACVLHSSCEDCLGFHVGALASLLPPNMTGTVLARELSEHVRKLRGYAWSIGGYHYTSRIWHVTAWAGPWLVDERWWDPAAHRRLVRLQATTDQGGVYLLRLAGGRWWVEAIYD